MQQHYINYTLSTNTNNIQIKVKGWKQYYNDTNYTVTYNEELVNLSVHTGNVGTTASWQEFHTVITNNSLKPIYHVSTLDKYGDCVVRITGDTGKVGFKNVRNTSQSLPNVYAELIWKKR